MLYQVFYNLSTAREKLPDSIGPKVTVRRGAGERLRPKEAGQSLRRFVAHHLL